MPLSCNAYIQQIIVDLTMSVHVWTSIYLKFLFICEVMCTDYSLFSAILGVFNVTLSCEMVLALNYRQLCEGFSVGSIFIWDFHNPSAVYKCITSFFFFKTLSEHPRSGSFKKIFKVFLFSVAKKQSKQPA